MEKLTDAQIRATVEAWEANERNVTRTAHRLGIGRSSVSRHLEEGKLRGILGKPRIRVPAEGRGGTTRVVVISDTHDSPSMPKAHLSALAEWVIDQKPDVFVHGGDFLTLDSVSTHEQNWTLRGQQKPSFQADVDSGYEALDLLMSPIRKAMPALPCKFTKGNHEFRVNKFVNEHPELRGQWDVEIDQMFVRHGFHVREYGDWHFIDGVGFTHVPLGKDGRPVSGVNPGNTIALGATFDIVFGHTHNRSTTFRTKFGPSNGVTVINTGCSMPDGHVEQYARLSATGWWWGGVVINIASGRIQDHSFHSLGEIMRRYG